MIDHNENKSCCPHCGKDVDPLRAPAVSVIAGKIAHFCSPSCREQHLQRDTVSPPPASAGSETPEGDTSPETPQSSAPAARSDKDKWATEQSEGPRVSQGNAPPPSNLEIRPFQPRRLRGLVRFSFLKTDLISLALRCLLLIIALAAPYFSGKNQIITPLLVGLGALGIGIQSGFRHRRRGLAIVAEHIATPLAAVAVLLSALGSTSSWDASIVAASLLLTEGIGRILEMAGRMRSGVEQVIEGTNSTALSSAWRDNSPLAASLRRFSLFLDWARFPLAAAAGLFVYFVYDHSLASALIGTSTALIALGPRAIRLSTGDAHLSAALLASARGIIIRDAHVLDKLAGSRLVLFMASRSLFRRKASVVDWSMENQSARELALRALGSLEYKEKGRIPQAISAYVESCGVQFSPADEVTKIKGKGLLGDTEVGPALAGNRMLLLENGISTALLEDKAKIIEKSGRRALFLAVNGAATAVFGLEETPKRGTETIALKLKSLGFEPILMTSSEIVPAQSIGARLGIDSVRFGVRDEQVGELIGALSQTGEQTTLVGNGPSFEEHLGAASASIAVGGETNTTQAGVDARQVEIDSLPWLFKVAKRAKISAEANLVLSSSVMTVGMALALGWFSPYTVVFAAALAFGASALNTVNGPYRRLDNFLSKTSAFTTSIRKRAVKKWAALR